MPDPQAIARALADARRHTLELFAELDGERLFGPRRPICNPPLWEVGHVAWFQERWILRHRAGRAPLRADADGLYDSSHVPQATRWDLPLPTRRRTLDYMREVLERVLARLAAADATPEELYFHQLVLFHEDMHGEALAYTLQTQGWPRPSSMRGEPADGGPFPGDVEIPGGSFVCGAPRDLPFVFDNERAAHPLELRPFRIARAQVTQAEFRAFVEDGGYARRELWSADGWAWRTAGGAGAAHPVYWRREGDGWLRRDFDRWVALEPHRAMVHVNQHEARAFCRWAGRRLPREAEWERAARYVPGESGTSPGGGTGERFRLHPFEGPLTQGGTLDGACLDRGRLDARVLACSAVDAHPDGDSALGLRQLYGNVWEWTDDPFLPYPGFRPDPYEDYSAPWFGDHGALRGGSFATRARLLRTTLRSWTAPERRDLFTGLRTCALD